MNGVPLLWLAWAAAFPLGPPADRFGDPLPAGAAARIGFVRTATSSPLNLGDGPLAAFAPDGRLFATACSNRVYVWDVATGRVRRRFEIGDDHVGRLVFTADGRDLVARSHGGRFRRWRLDTGREVLGEVEGAGQWGNAQVSPGGRWLLSPQGAVWDLPRGERAWPGRLPINKGQASVAFSADERWLFVAGRGDDDKYTLAQWNVAAGKCERVFANVPTGPIVPSPDGRLVAVTLTIPDPGAANKWTYTVALYDTEAGRERLRLPASPAQFDRPVFSADGKRFAAVVGWKTLTIWDATDGKVVASWTYPRDHLGWLAFSPDGRRVGACGGEGTAVLWDVAIGKPRFLNPEVPYRVTDLSFAPDGRQLAGGYSDGSVRLWDLATQEVRHAARRGESPASSGVTNLGWLGPDGPLVLRTQAAAGGEFRLLDPKTGRDTPLSLGDGVEVQSVSPAGRTIVVGPGIPAPLAFDWRPLAAEKLDVARKKVADRPELRDFRVVAPVPVPDPAPLTPLNRFPRSVAAQAVAVSADGCHVVELVIAMADPFGTTNAGPHWSPRGLRVVDTKTGHIIRELGRTQQHSVAFTPDGRGLVFWRGPFTDFQVELLEARTGQARWKVTPGKMAGNVAVSPDGRWLALTELEGDALHFLDATTGKAVVTHRAGRIYNGPDPLAFSPDGRWLARAAQDGTILIWPAPAARPRNANELSEGDLTAAWRDLASADAAVAFRALVRLADAPASAVPLLRRELLREDDRERIERLVAGLDAAAFADRERATRELAALGEVARPFLVKGVRAGASLEAQTRVEKLLAAIADPFATPAGLRQLRAVEALERIGSADARRVLDRLAAAGPDDPLAREARRAADRLGR
jgi:WD40 repeat protein